VRQVGIRMALRLSEPSDTEDMARLLPQADWDLREALRRRIRDLSEAAAEREPRPHPEDLRLAGIRGAPSDICALAEGLRDADASRRARAAIGALELAAHTFPNHLAERLVDALVERLRVETDASVLLASARALAVCTSPTVAMHLTASLPRHASGVREHVVDAIATAERLRSFADVPDPAPGSARAAVERMS
jgi:hypothetical protein